MMRDELANDRTFLAWFRTGIAVMGLGFVVAKVALFVQGTSVHRHAAFYTGSGVAIVLLGGVLIGLGHLLYTRTSADIRANGDHDDTDQARWPLVTTVAAFATAILLSILLIVSSP